MPTRSGLEQKVRTLKMKRSYNVNKNYIWGKKTALTKQMKGQAGVELHLKQAMFIQGGS